MLDVLRSPYPVQAVRPMHHWWLCPRVLAWFRVLMIMSLVKPPASAGPLSRIGDYLFAARGPGLFPWIRRYTTFPYERTVPRGPHYPLFHRSIAGQWQCYLPGAAELSRRVLSDNLWDKSWDPGCRGCQR